MANHGKPGMDPSRKPMGPQEDTGIGNDNEPMRHRDRGTGGPGQGTDRSTDRNEDHSGSDGL